VLRVVGADAVAAVDTALCRFARRYADQTEADHAALVAAVERGMLPVERGIRAL
jgi:hypothetical protein